MKFLQSNDWQYRLLRTICQGVIGVLIANMDLLIAKLSFDPAIKTMIVALCMAVLSPIMAELGRKGEDVPDTNDGKIGEEDGMDS